MTWFLPLRGCFVLLPAKQKIKMIVRPECRPECVLFITLGVLTQCVCVCVFVGVSIFSPFSVQRARVQSQPKCVRCLIMCESLRSTRFHTTCHAPSCSGLNNMTFLMFFKNHCSNLYTGNLFTTNKNTNTVTMEAFFPLFILFPKCFILFQQLHS